MDAHISPKDRVKVRVLIGVLTILTNNKTLAYELDINYLFYRYTISYYS